VFAKRSLAVMPPGLALALALAPVLEQIAEITIKIKQYDRQIQQIGQTDLRADPRKQAAFSAKSRCRLLFRPSSTT
jgi:hypothetical protein